MKARFKPLKNELKGNFSGKKNKEKIIWKKSKKKLIIPVSFRYLR